MPGVFRHTASHLAAELSAGCVFSHGVIQTDKHLSVEEELVPMTIMNRIKIAAVIAKESIAHPTMFSTVSIEKGKVHVLRESPKEFHATHSLHT